MMGSMKSCRECLMLCFPQFMADLAACFYLPIKCSFRHGEPEEQLEHKQTMHVQAHLLHEVVSYLHESLGPDYLLIVGGIEPQVRAYACVNLDVFFLMAWLQKKTCLQALTPTHSDL